MTKQSIVYPCDQTYWYLKRIPLPSLKKSHSTQILVVGGGMAGLSAAQAFAQKGCKVTLIEKYFCGSGATGKSSGFITPNSELGLENLEAIYGLDNAKKLWEFVSSGVDFIRKNIENYSFECDYRIQDTVVVANTKKAIALIQDEHAYRRTLSYDSTLYTQDDIGSILGSTHYFGAIRYGGTFSINAYDYCQAMKRILHEQGVEIFEETPALQITAEGVIIPHGIVKADYIVVCIDRSLPELGKLVPDIYQIQTFLCISQSLSQEEMKTIFPDKQFQVWDTDLIYHYFRPAQDERLLVGGSDIIASYWGHEQHHNYRMYTTLQTYMQRKFPQIKWRLTFMWPGLIGMTKDIIPIACRDSAFENVYYISAATGLPWAAALGSYSMQNLLENRTDLDSFFSPHRRYPISNSLQRILGKRISFGLSNMLRIYNKA